MINLSMAEPEQALHPRLTVMGVGGAGGNAINNMIRCSLEGCDFIAANTDAQALSQSLAPRKLQLGIGISRGLGAGSKPEIGRGAAEEQLADIMACLEGSDMLFVTSGMGGGTGTGAAPVIARAARESGILTVGVVTKPFHFEGGQRMRKAEAGIAELQQYVDTLIVIPNQNLFRIANERTTFAEAFRMADEVLHAGVRGITDLMVMPGFMNLDFADVKTVMDEMGKAMMGTGEAEGENRAIAAAEAAISNPLLDDVSMKGARGVLINITGGLDMTLFEVDQAANRIREEVDPDAQIKVGSTLGEGLEGRIRVSVIATGIDANIVNAQRSGTAGTRAPDGNPRTQVSYLPQHPQNAGSSHYFAMPSSVTPQMMAQQQPAQQPQAAPPPAPPAYQPPPQAAPAQFRQPDPIPPLPPAYQPPRSATPQPAPQQAAPQAQAPQAATPGQTPHPFDMRVTQLTTPAQQAAANQRRTNRSQSLFTRITGFGMVRPSEQQDLAESEMASDPGPAQSPRLGVDPADRPALSSDQPGDLLDIPAFLRRQTNH
ncbi:MAG TPA: cell division protein FtsZ [Alphaproteobacteria bacterium]|nr:cell division protein FtsZ [Alphaproteobacteria bacterium]